MTARVLAVTGATGFVGSAVLRRAVAGGWRLRALTRRDQPARDGVTWVPGTLDDVGALERLVVEADAVLHIAGATNAHDAAAFDAANAVGSAHVIDAMRRTGARRLIHVSSLAAREPELSAYGASKARAEKLIAASMLDWTIVRPPAVYGPGDRDMLELFRMARRGIVVVPPAGRMSIIHVDDLARLLLALAHAGEDVVGAAFEADDGIARGWTYRSFARALGWAFGRRVAVLPAPQPLLAVAARGDRLIRRARARLTPDRVAYFCHPDWVIDPARRPPASLWQPAIATQAGVKATAAWYREQGWL